MKGIHSGPMGSDRSFRLNCPPILHETVEDETIIVDLGSGSYYHLTGTGAFAWRLIEVGAGVPTIVGELAAHYDVPRETIGRDLDVFLSELVEEGLIVEDSPTDEVLADLPTAPALAYEAPALVKHTDMQELLLLDPIHDVDETGWPAAAR